MLVKQHKTQELKLMNVGKMSSAPYSITAKPIAEHAASHNVTDFNVASH
jgi:hypothetical protein